MRYLHRKDLLSLKAIIWNVSGAQRQTGTLTAQAEFIDSFAPKKIWDHVIIICKKATNPEGEAAGALEASYDFNRSKIQVIGYSFLDSNVHRIGPEAMKCMSILTDLEIKELIREKLNNISDDIQIIFNDVKCTDCGVIGDKRLRPLFYHMEKVQDHTKGTHKKHTQGIFASGTAMSHTVLVTVFTV